MVNQKKRMKMQRDTRKKDEAEAAKKEAAKQAKRIKGAGKKKKGSRSLEKLARIEEDDEEKDDESVFSDTDYDFEDPDNILEKNLDDPVMLAVRHRKKQAQKKERQDKIYEHAGQLSAAVPESDAIFYTKALVSDGHCVQEDLTPRGCYLILHPTASSSSSSSSSSCRCYCCYGCACCYPCTCCPKSYAPDQVHAPPLCCLLPALPLWYPCAWAWQRDEQHGFGLISRGFDGRAAQTLYVLDAAKSTVYCYCTQLSVLQPTCIWSRLF